MVKVAIAGIGFMGSTHFGAWGNVPNAKVGALCEENEKRLHGDWSDIAGNFGTGGGQVDVSGMSLYNNIDDLVADDSIDLIDVCLPSWLHKNAVIKALKAGRNVVTEKPIALSLEDANEMIAAGDESGKLFHVAQVLRFWPEWRWLKTKVDSGEFGKLTALNIRRVISAPDWSRNVADLGANGGPLIDLHIHDVDFICYLLGRPQRVFSTGRDMGTYINYVSSSYDYGSDGPTVSAQGGAVTMKARAFQHHFEAYFEQATVTHAAATEPDGIDPGQNQSANQVLSVYHADGTVEFPDTGFGEAFASELQHLAECVEQGVLSPVLNARNGRDSLALVMLEAESVRTGKVIDVP